MAAHAGARHLYLHPPGDRRPRLEVALGVDAERWLVATVRDLWTRRTLMHRQAVVRLL